MVVRGEGSHLRVPLWMVVGSEGHGTLTVDQGGVVDIATEDLTVGRTHGTGSVTVDGVDSRLNVADALRVGYDGVGDFDVTNQAVVDVRGDLKIGTSSRAYSSEYYDWYRTVGQVSVSQGAELSVGGSLLLGDADGRGQGTLSVLGTTVTIQGNSTLHAANEKTTLLHLDGGTLSTNVLTVPLSLVTGSGQINATYLYNQDIIDDETRVYDDANPVPTWSVNQGLSIDHVTEEGVVRIAGLTGMETSLVIGGYSQADVTVTGNQNLDAPSVQIGQHRGSQGTLTIDGPNAQWTVQDPALDEAYTLGARGEGTLHLKNGGRVSTQSWLLGDGVLSLGTIRVSGAETTMDMDTLLMNTGRLIAEEGASVSVGALAMNTADIIVSGGASVTVAASATEWPTLITEKDNAGHISVQGAGSRLDMSGTSMGSSRVVEVSDGGYLKALSSTLTTVSGSGTVFDIEGRLSLSTIAGRTVEDPEGFPRGHAIISDGAVVNCQEVLATQVNVSGYYPALLTVTGAGTELNSEGALEVRSGAHLVIADGAKVTVGLGTSEVASTAHGVLSESTLVLSGAGAELDVQGSLSVSGDTYTSRIPKVSISDGARLNVEGGLYFSQAILDIQISGHGMLQCGGVDSSSMHYTSELRLSAMHGLSAGNYLPIMVGVGGEFDIQADTTVVGGRWNPDMMIYSVAPSASAEAGLAASVNLLSQQRLTIGSDLEMQFQAADSSTLVDVTASETAGQWLGDLRMSLDAGQQFLSAYDFEVTGLSDTDVVTLCMQVASGLAPDDLQLWHGSDELGWEQLAEADISITDGWAYFTVDSFSSYALSTDALIAGDANKDGAVDVGDLGILSTCYGLDDATWEMGDFNGDGVVNVGDLGILSTYYGSDMALEMSSMSLMSEAAAYGQIASVPEPCTALLLSVGATALLRRKRRK